MGRIIPLNWSLLLVALVAQACAHDEILTPNGLVAGAAQSAAAGRDAGSTIAGAPAPGSREDCSARENQATAALSPLLESADRGCTRDADCMQISIDTLCHAACGWIAASVNVAAIDAAIAEQNARFCAQFVAVGCHAIIPPCTPPFGTPTCKSGACTLTE